MPDDQQLIGVLDAKDLDADQRRCNHDGMIAVRHQGIRAHEPRQPFATQATEAHVMAEFFVAPPDSRPRSTWRWFPGGIRV